MFCKSAGGGLWQKESLKGQEKKDKEGLWERVQGWRNSEHAGKGFVMVNVNYQHFFQL